MRLSNVVIASAFVGAFALAAVPAHAQHRGGGGQQGGSGGARAAAPRAAAPRQVFAPRASVGPRVGMSRVARPGFAPSQRFGGVAGPRAFGAGPRTPFASRGAIVTRGFVGSRGFAPRVIGPRVIVAPLRFSRPFYAFRPRFTLGFGLFVGFPVAYPYYYGYPYGYSAYPYPYPYASAYPYPYASSGYGYGYPDPSYGYPAAGYPASTYPPQTYPAQTYPAQTYPGQAYPSQTYPPSGSVGVQQGAESGGLSFEITPSTARVVVDGTEVGTVAEFAPTTMPLTLTLGRHHIELRVAGYQTMSFDAEIVAGQVIPYRGTMQPIR